MVPIDRLARAVQALAVIALAFEYMGVDGERHLWVRVPELRHHIGHGRPRTVALPIGASGFRYHLRGANYCAGGEPPAATAS
jgi:hypothetical protein